VAALEKEKSGRVRPQASSDAATRKKGAKNSGRKYPYVPRDPAATRQRILDAAVKEFAAKGLGGARVDSIAKSANANMRMLYHYFNDKEQLYIAAIEEVYRSVRLAEQDLHIEREEDPRKALERLIVQTFDYFAANPDLINIVMNENILHARYFKRTELIPRLTTDLSHSVRQVLEKGVARSVFVRNPDPLQLWLTIFSLCWVHLSNKYTMSWTLQIDLTDPDWLEERKKHVIEVVMAFLCRP
jgi:AcrR family transcriptional regulator